MRVKLTPEQRKVIIANAVTQVCNEYGELFVTHVIVANECTVPTTAATVRHYFPTKADLIATQGDTKNDTIS